MTSSTEQRIQSHTPPRITDLAERICELAGELKNDMDAHERRRALAAIQELERILVTLEYELLDGEERGEGDAC